MRIFISYASEQLPLAEELAAHLRQEGHRTSVSFEPGTEFADRIRKAIHRADLFVFLISHEALTHGRYTLSELEFASQKWPRAGWHILPVLANPVDKDELPAALRPLTYLSPKGDLVAEVVAHIAELERARRTKLAAGGALLGLVLCAGAAYLLVPQQPRSRPSSSVQPHSAISLPPMAGEQEPTQIAFSDGGSVSRPTPTAIAGLAKTVPPKKPAPPLDPLSAFRSDPRCVPQLESNRHGWYLTCVCRDNSSPVHSDLYIGDYGARTEVPTDLVVTRARERQWNCP